MKIDKQIKEANKETKKLHHAILELNNILNKNDEGCYIDSIQYDIHNYGSHSTLTVRYKSNNSECNAFFCTSELKNY